MSDLGKCILVTNNDRVAEEQGNKIDQVVPVKAYEEVLLKTRDLIHTNHKLLTHPQASGLEPNQTLRRTILLYSEAGKSGAGNICLTEEATEVFNKWTAIKKVPKYGEKIAYDCRTIDLSMIENVTPKLQE